jgi:pilus assembly protein FimV
VHPITAHEFSRPTATDSRPRPAAGRQKSRSRWTGAWLLLASLALQDAWGLALGQARVQSAIGEPLQLSVELPVLSAEEAETLQVSVADAAAFQAAGLEFKPLLAELKVELGRTPGGMARLSLRGQRVVNDAYLDLLLQASWKGGQLTRRYSLLLSPSTSQTAPEGLQAVPAALPQPAAGTPLPPVRPLSATRSLPVKATHGTDQPRTEPVRVIAAAPAPAVKADAPAQSTQPPQTEAQQTPVAASTMPQPAPAPIEPAAPPAIASPETSTVPAPAPPTATQTVPAPETTASWPERLLQPVWLGACALLLAGLAVLLAWQRRRQAVFQAVEPAEDSLLPSAPAQAQLSAAVSTAAAPSTTAAAETPSKLAAQADTAGEIDPVAEADVYLAYGRVQQAEQILHDALRSQPGSLPLHLKLLEIAVQRGDRAACADLMPAIATLTDRTGPEWDNASGLLGQLPPEPPAISTPLATEQTSRPAASSPADTSIEFDLSTLAVPSAPATEPARSAADTAATQDRGLDFELDLSELGQSAPEATAASAKTAGASPAASHAAEEPGVALDFEPGAEIPSDELSALLVKEDNNESDPLATQLELAEEFLALGDAEGARPLAERVQALATGELQSRARALLQQLDAGPH